MLDRARAIIVALLPFLLARPAAAGDAPPAPREREDAAAQALFREADVDGAFVLLDVTRNELTLVNPAVAGTRHVPFSTFKIANAIVALETDVAAGPNMTLRWDGRDRGFAGWNRDHTLATAMAHSAVWYYQEIARRVGLARMRRELARLGYGNADVGDQVDRFWLDGPMRISPREQVAFLRRLQAGHLPIRSETAATVRELIVLERGPGFVLRGKTGLGPNGPLAVGWLVGETEHGGAPYVYALLVLAPRGELDRVSAARRPLAMQLLRRYGALPPEAVR